MSDSIYAYVTPNAGWHDYLNFSYISHSIEAVALLSVCLVGACVGWRKAAVAMIAFVGIEVLAQIDEGISDLEFIRLSELAVSFAWLTGIIAICGAIRWIRPRLPQTPIPMPRKLKRPAAS